MRFPLRALGAIVCLCALLVLESRAGYAQRRITPDELDRIGRRIWQNECGGSISGLTSWNSGESFASLGIGHFIWYPTGQSGPFEESFPPLISFLQRSRVKVPQWLVDAKDCPWPNRAAFMNDHKSSRMKELRELLSRTVVEQTLYIIERLNASAPRLQAAAGREGARVAKNMQLLGQSAAGTFAMIDYVNFKGEGLSSTERYKGQGWGLLQVLTEMESTDAAGAPRAFSAAAQSVLTRRVKNSSPERGEKQWLAGWMKRCRSYAS